MKILWLIPLTVDKAFQFTSKNELARGLVENGHVVETVVAYRKEKIRLDGFSHVEYVHTPEGSVAAMLRFHVLMLTAVWKTSADVVMFGFQSTHLIPLCAICSFWRKRATFVMDIRTVPVDLRSNLGSKIEVLRYEAAIRIADYFCDGITVITPMLADTVRPKLKRIWNKMGVWTSGVCFEDFKQTGPDMREELGLKGKKILFHHGTLSPNRGVQDAIRAVALLRDEIPNLVFLLVGDGVGRSESESLSNDLGLSNRIIFTGKVAYSKVSCYIRTADVSIIPFPNISWWAVSSPIKLMEYLAIGVPIVATDIAAHRWVAQKSVGVILARNSQPENLAACIKVAITSEKLRVPKRIIENVISWKSQAKNLVRFLNSLHHDKSKV